MYAKTLHVGVDKLEVSKFNEKIRGQKVKNNGMEVIK